MDTMRVVLQPFLCFSQKAPSINAMVSTTLIIKKHVIDGFFLLVKEFLQRLKLVIDVTKL